MRLTDQRELRALLERHGFHFSKSLGQNFLVAPWVPERIAGSSGAGAGVGALEVGPGVGCLTSELAVRAERVTAVELDRRLAPVLAESLGGFDNVSLVFADALKTDLCKLVSDTMPGLCHVVCANLPYNVTTPLLSAFIDAHCFEQITVMIQREVALRLTAAPGTADYGAFTVYVNWYCEAERLFDVPPDCFMPRPKVTSSVVRLIPRKAPPCAVQDEKFMLRCVRAAFGQRRKTLQNALVNGLPGLSKEDAAAAINACGLDEKVRGETLSMEMFAKLADVIKNRG